MATSLPGLNGHQNGEDHAPDRGLTNLSLSSKTVHADDFLNNNAQDVAPALHVSTTYRYNRDPDKLQTLASMGVCPLIQGWGKSADILNSLARTFCI